MGVGTGDVQIAFDQQYEKENSILLSKNRHRAHNMYLTVFISFGLVGLILFLGVLYTYFKENLANKELIPVLFISAVITTFMIEDTIETQMGVCLISLFLGLFMSKIESRSITTLDTTSKNQ
jgi:O-antigen ligase